MNLKNNLPSGPITAKNGRLYIGTKEIFLYGCNYTFDSVTAFTPDEFAAHVLARGENWVRFHKMKEGIDIYPYVDALYKVGIRSSIDILLAEDSPGFYENTEGRREKFVQIAKGHKGLLAHPGLFLVCLLNEGGHRMLGRPNMVQNLISGVEFGAAVLRELGFRGLIGDLPDANIDPPKFVDAVKRLDVALCHGYGVHPQGQRYQEPLWSKNAHFAGVSYWLRDLTGKPMLFQELGCLFPAQNRGINEAFHVQEALLRGCCGICLFQAASNHAQMRGEYGVTDMFSAYTDPLRLLAWVAGALMVKHRGLSQSTESQVEVTLGENTGSILIKPSPKKRVLIRLGRSSVEGFKSRDVGDNWKQIDSPGNSTLWHPEGKWIDVGAPVSSAKQIDPRTLEVVASLQVKGNRVKLLQELCLVEVTLK